MNPVRSGGILVILLTTVAIVSNAVFFQSSHHPSPFFATRPEVVPATPVAAVKAAPVPKSRGDAVEPELVRSEKLTVAPATPDAQVDSVTIIAIQDALAQRGMYDGKADGKLGAKTRAAIAAYEKKYGLPETGMPSDGLMAHFRRTETAEAKPAPDPATQRDDQITTVQSALNSIGYGPIPVTGKMSAETADSIRRFQLDNGMTITGEAGPDIVRKLVAIGAITQN
jgi:peptidoglycan hydrolase-like protein with peptidoglycan-binding domain